MNVICPNCGLAMLAGSLNIESGAVRTDARLPSPGAMVLCGSCGDVFEFQPTGLLSWSDSVPDEIAQISSCIKLSRARRRRWGKAAMN